MEFPNYLFERECIWNGHQVRFASDAIREMDRLNLNVYDICAMLPSSWDCAVSKRAQDTLEQCIDFKKQVLRMVLKKGIFDFDRIECYTIIHVKFAGKRFRSPT